jgi:ElaB/YqjD/DUF883 family membrane-anchored ribosome-binding protein
MASITRDRITGSGRDIAQTIRDNPLPAAVAAAGIGWLLLRAREGERPLLRRAVRRRLADEPERFGEEYEPYEGRALRGDVGEFGEEVRERARDLSERVQETAHRASQKAQDVRERVSERVQEAAERIGDRGERLVDRGERLIDRGERLADRGPSTRERVAERAAQARSRVAQKARDARRAVADRAGATARYVREGTRNTARRVEGRYNESPIGMGAVALAVGLAIGYSLPSTRREARVMGDARDRLADRARERVADAKDRIEGAIDRGVQNVQSAVREAGEGTV